ncbi:MAG: hypothetical protein ABI655_14085 [Phenylobacterium sp.]
MEHPHPDQPRETGEVLDFQEAFLDACPPELRAELLSEAEMLAQAFAPGGEQAELAALAQSLSSGVRDAEMGQLHARRLAAALRHLAKSAA